MADRNDADLDHYGDVTFQSGSTLVIASGATMSLAAGVQLRSGTTAVAASANAIAGYSMVDTTSGSVTITLPTLASTSDGTEYWWEKTVAANSMIIDGNGAETIEGAANVTRTAQHAVVGIRKAGSVWQLIDPLKASLNLADLGSASTARTNLGVPATASVLAVANNLSDVASAATSRTNLGVFYVIHHPDLDLVGANAAQWRYVHPAGAPSATISRISTVLSGALTTGDATVTADIEGTPVTDGVVTITQAGSAEDDVDSATPSAANVIAAGEVLTLTVGGTNDAARTAGVSVRLDY